MSQFGIIYGEPSAIYHASDAVGSHKLQDLSPFPILYYRRHIAKQIEREEESSAMAFGKYFHTLALEGENAANAGYAIAPICDRRTKDGKATYAVFQAELGSRQAVSAADVALAWRMVKSVREKPSCVALLSRGSPEVTFRHQLASFAIQARVDWFDDTDKSAPMIVDIKTVDQLGSFDSHFLKFGYYKQAAFYRLVVAKLMGIETFQPQFQYLVVEKEEPFQCQLVVPDAEALAIGTKEVMSDLARLKSCYESGVWPGCPDEPRGISLPQWKVAQST